MSKLERLIWRIAITLAWLRHPDVDISLWEAWTYAGDMKPELWSDMTPEQAVDAEASYVRDDLG